MRASLQGLLGPFCIDFWERRDSSLIGGFGQGSCSNLLRNSCWPFQLLPLVSTSPFKRLSAASEPEHGKASGPPLGSTDATLRMQTGWEAEGPLESPSHHSIWALVRLQSIYCGNLPAVSSPNLSRICVCTIPVESFSPSRQWHPWGPCVERISLLLRGSWGCRMAGEPVADDVVSEVLSRREASVKKRQVV